jgi:hypothetical protein
MLAYLDALLAALAARDITEIDRLLAHPLARILSPEALADATAERRAAGLGMPSVAPLRLLQFRYRTVQLLGERATVADAPEISEPVERRPAPQAPAWSDRRAAARQQMELPLSA